MGFQEMPRHVALVGKACRHGGRGERGATQEQAPHHLQAPHRQIAVWAGAIKHAKVVRQAPAVSSRRRFQFLQGDGARAVRLQVVARAPRRQEVAFWTLRRRAGRRRQRMRQFGQCLALFQRFERMAVVRQQGAGGRRQAGIGRHAAFDEGQGAAAQHVLEQRRFDIQHAVTEAGVRTRLAIVRLVGMQDHGIAGQAVALAAAIAETLHAGQRAADGVGVVAVHGIGLALEPRLDAFDSLYRFGALDPVAKRRR